MIVERIPRLRVLEDRPFVAHELTLLPPVELGGATFDTRLSLGYLSETRGYLVALGDGGSNPVRGKNPAAKAASKPAEPKKTWKDVRELVIPARLRESNEYKRHRAEYDQLYSTYNTIIRILKREFGSLKEGEGRRSADGTLTAVQQDGVLNVIQMGRRGFIDMTTYRLTPDGRLCICTFDGLINMAGRPDQLRFTRDIFTPGRDGVLDWQHRVNR